MRGLDDTDQQILALLLEDGRRPYSDIAEEVDLSPPAVSDRVDRLQEIGLIRRFTVDLDRSLLDEGVPLLVDIEAEPSTGGDLRDALATADPIDHVYTTADERVVFTATVPEGNVQELLRDAGAMPVVEEYRVHLLDDSTWSPSLSDADLSPDCAECGNTVTSEGEATTLDGERYHFCCRSCRSRFVETFERVQEGA